VVLRESRKPADKEHLVERIGLLAIVLLGESVISLTAGLTDVDWSYLTIITGGVGFSIVSMIWWIYFDSLEQLKESKKDKKGNAIIYSHLLTYMSFAIIANTIRHAILLDLSLSDFRFMAISGMILLYIGKQTAYIVNVPEYRRYILINTLIVLLIACASLLFSKPQYILIGMSFSFFVYILANYKSQMKLYGKVNF
jgi:low temperature requirement protein LtrA